jgi:hypothetical protein
VDRNKYQIQIPLPPKIDPSVTMMQVEEKPDVTYSDVGGSKEQIEKLREVVEMPLLQVPTLTIFCFLFFFLPLYLSINGFMCGLSLNDSSIWVSTRQKVCFYTDLQEREKLSVLGPSRTEQTLHLFVSLDQNLYKSRTSPVLFLKKHRVFTDNFFILFFFSCIDMSVRELVWSESYLKWLEQRRLVSFSLMKLMPSEVGTTAHSITPSFLS